VGYKKKKNAGWFNRIASVLCASGSLIKPNDEDEEKKTNSLKKSHFASV
jgi:hypothetical protein